jgi:hypothetical protein
MKAGCASLFRPTDPTGPGHRGLMHLICARYLYQMLSSVKGQVKDGSRQNGGRGVKLIKKAKPGLRLLFADESGPPMHLVVNISWFCCLWEEAIDGRRDFGQPLPSLCFCTRNDNIEHEPMKFGHAAQTKNTILPD